MSRRKLAIVLAMGVAMSAVGGRQGLAAGAGPTTSDTVAATRPASPYPDGRPAATLRMEARDLGVILRHGAVNHEFDGQGARDVWAWRDQETWYVHYDAAGPRGWLCSLATSKDLKHWVKHGPVLTLGEVGQGDSKSASYGVTYKAGDTWHMFYLGTPNTSPPPDLIPAFPYLTMKAKATSPAGPWTKQPEVVPFRPVPGTYYTDTASPGFIVKQRDEYLQFFSASFRTREGQIKRTIGLATTKDLDGSWRVEPKPLLPTDEQIENTSLHYEPGIQTWFMFTNHVGLESGTPEYTDAVWVYWSKDLRRWDASNKAVVLDGKNCTWSKRVIGLPSVVADGGRLLIFYDGLEGEGTSHMHRDIGLAELPLPLSIPQRIAR